MDGMSDGRCMKTRDVRVCGEAMAVQGMRKDDLAVAKFFAPIPALRAGGDREGATETAGAKAALVAA